MHANVQGTYTLPFRMSHRTMSGFGWGAVQIEVTGAPVATHAIDKSDVKTHCLESKLTSNNFDYV